MNSSEAIGRKLDFLVQEINREANTIGSKAQDVDIAKGHRHKGGGRKDSRAGSKY